MQELLRVEAMQSRLCEETIAAELRREPTEDVFSKAFGKKTMQKTKQSPRSISPSTSTNENKNDDVRLGLSDETSSPSFRRRLASTLGYADVDALDAAVARGGAARRAFVTHNFGLAASVADDVWGKLSGADRGLLSRDDLTLYGCAGLARAADRFDPDRGYKFSTYCYFWVRKAVVDSVKDCGRTIRLPKYLSEVLRETRKAEAELERKLGRLPSDAELAEATDVDVSRVREWRQWAMSPLSLDVRAGGAGADDGADALVEGVAAGGGSTAGGSRVPMQSVLAEDGGNPALAAEADADADLLRAALDEALATLLPREQFVLRHRFGLASASARALACSSTGDGTPPGWLQASSADEAEAMVAAEGKEGASRPLLGSLLGVSAETVRTIERRGLAKLKRPSRAGAVLAHVDDETRARMEQSDEGGLFAAALAEAAEKADRRAGGGRVFGAFAGGAVPASALGGRGKRTGAEASDEKAARGRRAPRRGKKVPRPASAKKQKEKERTSDGEKRARARTQKETEKEKEKEVIAIRSA